MMSGLFLSPKHICFPTKKKQTVNSENLPKKIKEDFRSSRTKKRNRKKVKIRIHLQVLLFRSQSETFYPKKSIPFKNLWFCGLHHTRDSQNFLK